MMYSRKEIWKDINNEFGERYQVSNYGKVRSKIFKDSCGRIRGGKILKYSLDKRGYPRFRLCSNYIKKSFRAHSLVAKAFIKNPKNKPQVNHKDGIKTNNFYQNLEWSTNSENQKHAIQNGLKMIKTGTKAYRFKSSVKVFTLEGVKIDELFGNADMKSKGYDFRNVSAVTTGKRKTYLNLIFKR